MTAAAPTTPTSTARGITLSVVVATVAAGIVNTVISLVSQALGADAALNPGLNPAVYLVFTLVGTIIGAIGWVIVRNRAADPAALIRWLAPTVVVVSWIPDVLLLLAGRNWIGVVGLMLMHPVVAATAVLTYRRFLPLPR